MMFRITFLIVAIFTDLTEARRYRTCAEGCCVHEYCAYHRICYPRIHCGLGCPDGQCVGEGQQAPEPGPQPKVFRSHSNQQDLVKSSEKHLISERYSYQDSTQKDTSGVDDTVLLPSTQRKETTNGICMPYQPCKEGEFCGLGHICSFNYNLGYHVCQYNLEIGSTLCYDRKGNPALHPMT